MSADMERRPESEAPDATSQVPRNRKGRRTHRDYCSGRTVVTDEAVDWIFRVCPKCGMEWRYSRCLAQSSTSRKQCRAAAVLPCDAPEWCASHAAPFRRKRAAP